MQTEFAEASPLARMDLEQATAAFIRGLKAADYSQRTVRAASSDLSQFRRFLDTRGVHDLDSVKRADLLAYVTALADPAPRGEVMDGGDKAVGCGQKALAQRPFAKSTIARKLSVVRTFLGFCEQEGLVQGEPCCWSEFTQATPAASASADPDSSGRVAWCRSRGRMPLRCAIERYSS